MKKILLVLTITLFSFTAFCQTENSRVAAFQKKIDSLITLYNVNSFNIYFGSTLLLAGLNNYHVDNGFITFTIMDKNTFIYDMRKLFSVRLILGKSNELSLYFD